LEYKLNKIDTEIRTVINEQSSEGRVHAKQRTELNSEELRERMQKEDKKRKSNDKEAFSISKYVKGNKTIEVKVYKSESIEVVVERIEESRELSDKGVFIDIRR
jgi:hypothetical protein